MNKNSLTIVTSALLLLTQTACLGGAYTAHAPASSTPKKRNYYAPGSQGDVEYEDDLGSNESSAEDDGSDDSSGGGTQPLYSFQVRAVGYTAKSFTVRANRTVRVKFFPGRQDRTVSGTGFTPNYAQLGVFIKVGDEKQATALLSNGLIREATSSVTMDFSDSFTRTCKTDSCRQDVRITVMQPNYDYWCYNYGTYCAYTHVHDTHPWNGTLEVATDDTVGLED